MNKLPCVLTIAGSDSGGGAGIQADLKTFAVHKTYGLSVITAVTSQNTKGVRSIQMIDPDIVKDQIDMVCEDFEIEAFKTGMLYSETIIKVVADRIKHFKLKNYVLDPVVFAGSGDRLLLEDAKKSLIEELFPLALVVTPNRFEAEDFSGIKIENIEDAKKAAKIIKDFGPSYVVVKGGHFGDKAIDVVYDGKEFLLIESEKVLIDKKFHGAGCSFSASIAANLALGYSVIDAIKRAKEFLYGALKNSFDLGKGSIPVNPLWVIS
ncbi:MAG: bifunctional hydroxymethylpyrimidine kinase/phosphomethylpyrimidine kinase [Candidatus Hydrothermales bacterium]